MKKIVFTLCAVLPCSAVAYKSNVQLETDCVKQLTMEDAVQLSLKHRPDLEALRYATQASKSGAKAAIAGYYPVIAVESNFSQDITQNAPTNFTQLTVRQTIFSFAGPQERYRQAKRQAEVAALDEDVREQDIRLEAETAFLEAFYLQEQAYKIQALSRSSEANFKRASYENKVQRMDKDAWLGHAEAFAADITTIQQFDVKLDQAYRKLEFLTGQSLLREKTGKTQKGTHADKERAELIWQHKNKIILEKLESYYAYALANRPEISKYAKLADLEHENIRLAQGDRLPNLSAAAHIGFDESREAVLGFGEDIVVGKKTFWNYSFALNWKLFDGMVSQHEERQARAKRTKEMLNRQQEILMVKQWVQDAYSALLNRLLELKAKKMRYMHARNTFKLSSQKYELGRLALNEFQTAETAWKDVQLEWILSNVNAALAEQTLIRACGYPAALS
jgi:outer membrane protein TolC